ncbi:MAG: twin-arginine translocation signal domain-containing protein [Planctomycetes bacterium]|nr:twin-arginine translocation signal domain-containing protein [Planctomycetota bacterium]
MNSSCSRRKFLQAGTAGVVSAVAFGPAFAAERKKKVKRKIVVKTYTYKKVNGLEIKADVHRADDRVTREERDEIEEFSKEHSLNIERRRFVHAALFHRCLGAVLDDGVIDAQERAQLKFLDRVLSSLGWSITDG